MEKDNFGLLMVFHRSKSQVTKGCFVKEDKDTKLFNINRLFVYFEKILTPCVNVWLGIKHWMNQFLLSYPPPYYIINFSFLSIYLRREAEKKERSMLDGLMSFYPWIKALHIMSVIAWMAGLFYLPRLYVYHTERAEVGSELDQTFQVMEDKLFRLIMTPSMIAAWVFGLLMIGLGAFDWGSVWVWAKLAGVIGMTGMHEWLGARRKEFAAGTNIRTGRTFRLMNEVPTLLMFVIVISVVVRPF